MAETENTSTSPEAAAPAPSGGESAAAAGGKESGPDFGASFGVVTRGDSHDAPGGMVPEKVNDKPAAPAPVAQAADPKATAAPADDKKKDGPDRSKPFTPEPDDPARPFKFGGEQFVDAQAAEHNYKTVRGMLPHLYQQVKQQSEAAAAQTRLATDNYNAAVGWQRQYEELKKQIESGTVAPAAAPKDGKPAASAPTTAAAGIDWDTFNYLANQPHIGVAGALAWYHEENEKLVEARLAKQREELTGEFDSRLTPLVGSTEQNQALGTLQGLIKEMSTYTLPAERGAGLAYPELADDEALGKIAELWHAAQLDPNLLLTRTGLENAVFRYRAFYPQGHRPAAQAAPSTTASAPAPQPAAPQPSSADTALALGGSHPPAARPGTPPAPADAVRARLRAAASQNNYWGVTAGA